MMDLIFKVMKKKRVESCGGDRVDYFFDLTCVGGDSPPLGHVIENFPVDRNANSYIDLNSDIVISIREAHEDDHVRD